MPALEAGSRRGGTGHPDHHNSHWGSLESPPCLERGEPQFKSEMADHFDRGVMDRHDPRVTKQVHVERVA